MSMSGTSCYLAGSIQTGLAFPPELLLEFYYHFCVNKCSFVLLRIPVLLLSDGLLVGTACS